MTVISFSTQKGVQCSLIKSAEKKQVQRESNVVIPRCHAMETKVYDLDDHHDHPWIFSLFYWPHFIFWVVQRTCNNVRRCWPSMVEVPMPTSWSTRSIKTTNFEQLFGGASWKTWKNPCFTWKKTCFIEHRQLKKATIRSQFARKHSLDAGYAFASCFGWWGGQDGCCKKCCRVVDPFFSCDAPRS